MNLPNTQIPYCNNKHYASIIEDTNTPDILTISLIVLFHVRFIFLIILQTRTIAIDLIFYLLVFAAFCTMRLNKYCLVLVPLLAISLFNSAAQNIFLLLSSSYIIAVKLPFEKVLKVNIVCIICVILAVTLMVKLGIIKEYIGTSHFYIKGEIYNKRLRSDMGFGNPNRVGLLIYSLIINAYLLFTKRKLTTIMFIVVFVSMYVYTLTNSRTFLFSIGAFILSYLGLKFPSMRNFFLKSRMLLFYVPLIFLILLFYLVKTGYYSISVEVITSGRLGLFEDLISHCSLQDYLIGTNMINDKTIDNSYLHLLFSAGVLGFVPMEYLWFKLLKDLNKTSIYTYPILLSIIIYGFGESLWVVILCYGNMIIWIMMIKNLILPETYKKEIRSFAN